MHAHAFPIRVPSDVLEALGEYTGHFWSNSLALEPHICEAIRNYMKPAPPAQQQQQQPAPSEAGYQWKEVFLPEGTKLRASFGGQPYFAVVEGVQIKYGRHAVSPSCFANLHGSGNRNAWKAVWLRLPGSDQWLLADVCRSAQKAAIARLIGDGAHQDPERSRASAAPPQDPVAQPAPRPAAGSGRDDGKRAAAPAQPAAQPAANVQIAEPKSGPGRHGRHKRRAKKQIPGNSR